MTVYPDKSTYLTTAGPIQIDTPHSIATQITREQLHNVDFAMIQPNVPKVDSSFLDYDDDPVVFQKKKLKLYPFAIERPDILIEKQLLELDFEHCTTDLKLAETFDEVMDRAAVSAVENFAMPTVACVLPGMKAIILDINGDCIRFMWKMTEEGPMGTLVALTPMKLIVASYSPAAAMGAFVGKLGLR